MYLPWNWGNDCDLWLLSSIVCAQSSISIYIFSSFKKMFDVFLLPFVVETIHFRSSYFSTTTSKMIQESNLLKFTLR